MRYLLTVLLGFILIGSSTAQTYRALYRPQFHFSPLSGWIGDPDGMIKFDSTYHLYWWGHATSKDLVYWHEEPWPMKGDDGSFTYFSGSVAVDKENTSGFALNNSIPFVAVYTMNRKADNMQQQGISISNDSGQVYNFYSGNPVLDIGSKDFRDPTVFWYEPGNKWVMIIVSALLRQANLYSSPDLKTWTHMSDFGPFGAREQVWEVPDLFQLPVNGDSTNMKWVLLSGMGPNKAQYFIGDFNGTTFTMDTDASNYLTKGIGIPGTVFEDFEQADYSGWTATGTAFALAPAIGTLPGQQGVSGFLGQRLINSFSGGDISTGTLTSSDFTIQKKCINFLIGAGNHPGLTCINLVVDGAVVRTETGANNEILKWKGWNVADLKGKTAKIQIVDSYTASWGHINIDQITFSDILYNFGYEHANWVDYGPDFYAVRTYNDYDKTDTSKVWMAWMGNWEYANQVPTSWGKGFQSIPRVIELKKNNGRYYIVQKPVPALQKLRGTEETLSKTVLTGIESLTAFKPTRNTYEINTCISFDSTAGKFGFNFCVAGSYKMVLGFDPVTSNIYIDRRYSGTTQFSSNFPKVVYAPVALKDTSISLHIFVDQSSLEVFVNDGEIVLSSLMFPDTKSVGIETFSDKGNVAISSFSAWDLTSIWGIPAPWPTGINQVVGSNESLFMIFPNPVQQGSEISIIPVSKNIKNAFSAELFTSQGKSITQIPEKVFNNSGNQVSLNYPSGIYLLRLSSKTEQEIHRLVIN
jgi:fructan beta-fructosidase